MTDRPTVLIVEDEVLIAMDLQAMLEDYGWSVIGPAGTTVAALALLEAEKPQFAVLDINLGNHTSFEVADQLIAHQVPFLFLSGANTDMVPDRFHAHPLLQKPIRFEQVVTALQRTLA